MKKFLIFLLVFVLVIAGGVLGVGYTQDTKAENRTEVIINAPIEKVWVIVQNPKRTPEWLPKHVADIEKVDMLATEGSAESTINSIMGTTPSSAKKDTATHRYFIKGGKTMDMEKTQWTGYKYMERVVGGNSGMEGYFESMEWGFELGTVPNESGKTRLTCVSRGVSKRPLGTFVQSVMRWTGKPTSDAKEMAANIEKLANAAK